MTHLTTPQLSNFKKASKIFRAINHNLRKAILEYLWEGQKTVTEIYVAFRIEQSVASQHLKILRDAGMVTVSRNGEIHFV